ncbi:transcriptional regulator, GntR family [Paenibacillus sp. 1_12]|uniref:FadR/GntR family transcriptional regulator n=1 Tax=Paenibacillus sp. 1_12 TaxID=1566278 RepID=UPI0008E82FD2|nr:FadR/GntR family transcriptional regulator [Paenibacillus sp. 1_12]SFL59907.1 transcriptional regulator, GntR family [Paenibacillus sp. 1_12]
MLQKTTRLTLVDQVIIQLESMIESGTWPIGTKIPPEPGLVNDLNVSRNTLREGIKALCHAGVLTTKQGDGTYVSSTSALGAAIQRRVHKSGLLDTLEVRNALEQEAARLSAERRTEEDLAKIRFYQQECLTFRKKREMEQYVAADMKLHQTIVESTGNQMLIDLYEHITEAIRESITVIIKKKFSDNLLPNAHDQLVDAIFAQDSDAAVQHVQQFIKEMKQAIEQEDL